MVAVLLTLSIVLDASGVFRAAGWPNPSAESRQLAETFIIQVESSNTANSNDLPPLTGSYAIEGDQIVFTPRYALQPGLTYRATLNVPGLPPVVQHFKIPDTMRNGSSHVEQIYPSASVVPENLLKFYLQFSHPMRRGEAYRHIRLLDERGESAGLPFLELNQELWDPGMRRFTLYFDPGRIKSGVLPHEQKGFPIREGHTYTLVIDADWRDSDGQPLLAGYEKRFTVESAARRAIDPSSWKVIPPRSGTLEALTIEFSRPLDHALLEHEMDVIDSRGHIVEGSIEIDSGDARWRFAPARKWVRGNYKLRVGSLLADLAGNTIDRPFEIDRIDEIQSAQDRASAKNQNARLVPFVVGNGKETFK